ncbi:MAG: farnesyl-diphosphate synthase [Rhodospirillales bacterium]|jgi:farnesyl diphosphate synthase|nr:farnesyl-diphosphate synthase [Rhodospirillales bacterium]
MTDLERSLKHAAAEIERVLDLALPVPDGPEARVVEAMRYAVTGPGKRLRPYLVLSSAELFGVNRSCALRVAAAVELLHCYSLVHDDLPALDDSDTRRGRPSVHREYDEATAILAGDALLTLAFEILSEAETHGDPMVRCELVRALAVAAGTQGMVGGQMLDLAAERQELDIGAITRMQRLKTGELIAFSCEAGAILGHAAETPRKALRAYAHDLGLAFQIVDDLIDAEGDAATAGKPTGQDRASGKATFVSLLGAERAREQARMLARQASAHLDLFEEKADPLRAVARFVVDRRN